MQTVASPLGSAPSQKPVSEVPPALAHTPLHAFHLRHGAKMVPFAGYDMPLQYPAGLLKEHLHTRNAAGLFDVSHMGQIALRPRSGNLADAARALETLLPIDVLGLKPGRQRYGLLTEAGGGILDDLMVANLGDRFLVVVNASRKAADEAHLRTHLSGACMITVEQRALVALQGPKAEASLAQFAPEVAAMRFMDAREIIFFGAPCVVTRSGYTGEDGFEISVLEDHADALAEALLRDPAVAPVGLGARDSLRLEAGLCLYGADIDEGTTPIEASLGWAIQPVRRQGGARAGGFPGAGRILAETADGAARQRVNLRPDGRTPVRAGAPLFKAEENSEPVGRVTSGGFGPSVGAPVAMGYIPAALAQAGQQLVAEVRGQRLPVVVSHGPFVPPGFSEADPSPRSARMLKFTEEHEWLKLEGDVASVGITTHAAEQLGDLVFIELPKVGATLTKGQAAAVVESVKAASDVYAPIGGEVTEVNEAAVGDPAMVGSDPQGEGWLYKIRIADPSALDGLMDEAAYAAFAG